MMRPVGLKQHMKSAQWIVRGYTTLFTLLYSLDPILPMTASLKLQYWISTGRRLNLKNPVGFDQKIQWLKAHYRNPLYVTCADKYEVRGYVESCGCGEILNELYGVYDDVNRIDFQSLPSAFVLKTTGGCGQNVICRDRSALDEGATRSKLAAYLKQPCGRSTGESHYRDIPPRVVVERYLGDADGALPIDYKFFCFGGVPYCVSVLSDRDPETCGHARMHFFDLEWRPMRVALESVASDPSTLQMPSRFRDMIKIAATLARPFPFVRIDLFCVEDTIVFGEMTFTPTGGYTSKIYTPESNAEFGQRLVLPPKSATGRWCT